jgi:hypothetical protein
MKNGTKPTMPQHAVADIFFYNELCSSIGHVHAHHWLATASSMSYHDPTCEDDTFDIARLMNEHDDKVGVFFTDAAHELLGSPRSVASNCSSRCSTLSTTPQRGLPTIADFFFYNELRSTLGHVHAEHWMTSAASPYIRSRPACSIEPQNGRSAASPRVRSALGHVEKENWMVPSSPSLPASQASSGEANKRRSRQDGECDLARLMNEHGDKVGLLFTDAAHELLDSPRVSEKYGE